MALEQGQCSPPTSPRSSYLQKASWPGILLSMDASWWAYVAPLASAVLGGLVGLGLERYRSRRRRLSYAFSVERLVSDAVPLTVSYQEHAVDAPHLVTARLVNEGPQDVTIDDFKGGVLGIRITGCTLVAPVQRTLDGETLDLDTEAMRDGLLAVRPTLIPQGSTIELSVLVSGSAPSVKQTIRLRQTLPVDSNEVRMEPRVARSLFRQGVAFAVITGLMALGLLTNLAAGQTSASGGPLATGILAIVLAAMTAFVAVRVLPRVAADRRNTPPSGL